MTAQSGHRSRGGTAPAHRLGERLLRFTFTTGELGVRSCQLAQSVGVGEDRDRLFQGIKVIRRQEDRRRATVNGHRYPVVLTADPPDELGQMSLDLGQRKSLRHGHKYDQFPQDISRPRQFKTLLSGLADVRGRGYRLRGLGVSSVGATSTSWLPRQADCLDGGGNVHERADPGEEVPLTETTATDPQVAELARGFDAFADRVEMQSLGKSDDRPKTGGIGRVVLERMQELLVDLDQVNRELA